AFAGAVQGFVRPAKPALRGLECPGRMDLFDVAGVVGDHRERLESQVDPACGCVRVDGAAGVDVGAVDVELEGHPPTPGLLPDRRPDDPGPPVGDLFGQPRHVLAGGDIAGHA